MTYERSLHSPVGVNAFRPHRPSLDDIEFVSCRPRKHFFRWVVGQEEEGRAATGVTTAESKGEGGGGANQILDVHPAAARVKECEGPSVLRSIWRKRSVTIQRYLM